VTYLPTRLVCADGLGVNHGNDIFTAERDGRIGRGQGEVRSRLYLGFRDKLTRANVSNTSEAGSKDGRGIEHGNGNRDKLCVLEVGYDALNLKHGVVRLGRNQSEDGGTGDQEF